MGSQRKLIESLQNTINSLLRPAITQAQTEPPELTRLKGDATSFLDSLKGGDLRNLKTGTFWNMRPLAQDEERRRLNYNAGASGQAALGATPSALLQLDKQNQDAHAAADYGSEFQNEVEQQTANAKNTLLGVGQQADSRNLGILGPLTSLTGLAATVKKPDNFLTSLLKGGLNALPGILAAF